MNLLNPIQSSNTMMQAAVEQLTGQEINSLDVKRGGMLFRLIKGRAWITIDDNDVIVEQDEEVHLPISKHRVIISSANPYQAIQYQLLSA